MIKILAKSLVLVLLVSCGVEKEPQKISKKPNIIVILTDDMGYSDIGCYGAEVNTPNIDNLARNGLRFKQFYNTGRCCPTRASLLTGLYPHQTGLGWMTAAQHKEPGYTGELNKQCLTIAQVLKPAGYSNYAVGKWHVSGNTSNKGDKHNWPLQRGFDRFYGTIRGGGSYFDPYTLTRGNQQITPWTDSEYQPGTFYYTDAISDNAVRFIKEHNEEKPFFMYVAYTAAHWPMHALPKDIARYEGKYDQGWAAIRDARYQRMLDMGIIDKSWKKSDAVYKPWQKEERKEWMADRMEVYAAMIDNMDQGVGRIVESLKMKGEFDNTLILYLHDNGGCAEEIQGHRPLDEEKVKTLGVMPIPKDSLLNIGRNKRTRDGAPVLSAIGVPPGPEEGFIAYGREWANVSNVPFREFKHYVHEGGISTPLIAHWPAKIKDKGTLRNQMGHLIDIMSTCIDISGAQYPKDSVLQIEGLSLVPAFENKPLNRSALYWEHEANRAIRVGKWKLVSKGQLFDGGYGTWKKYAQEKWELYDMEMDRSELNDISEQHPELVKELAEKWQAKAISTHVYPYPWHE